MEVVKLTLGSRGITVEAVRQWKDRKEWRSKVHMLMIEFYVEIVALFLCSCRPPSRSLVAYHLKWGGMPLHDAAWVNW